MRIAWVIISLFMVACTESPIGGLTKATQKSPKNKPDSQRPTPEPSVAGLATKALTDDEALDFIKKNCVNCHGKGADLHSTWPLPSENELTMASLQSMTSMAGAYQSLIHRLSNVAPGHRPSPMPPDELTDANRQKLEGLIYWFQLNLPAVVKEAEDTYGANDQFGSTLPVNLNYQCSQRSKAQAYIYRLFNTALGRTPTPLELDTFLPVGERHATLTNERRAALAMLVTEGELKPEFLKYGLRIFAKRIGGAGSIRPNPDFGLLPEVVNDLREEFYQLLLTYVEASTYRDILLMDKVRVTSNTFKFYDTPESPCADPGPEAWGECQLGMKRGNFFGTVGFLRSVPSSYLASNNNYRRGGEIHAILRGERLMAQTDGPPGNPANPLPGCLTTRDQRKVLNKADDPTQGASPRGALAVPRQGAVCQSCHLYKFLGIASFVFRPFDENGLIMTPDQINQADQNPYAPMVKAATAVDIINVSADGQQTAVDAAFLQDLLAEIDRGQAECITDQTGLNILKSVKSIKDLVEYMAGDGKVLIHGLSRYVPSALSSLPLTNQELIAALARGFEHGGGKLLPVFRAYFESETFSCGVGGDG